MGLAMTDLAFMPRRPGNRIPWRGAELMLPDGNTGVVQEHARRQDGPIMLLVRITSGDRAGNCTTLPHTEAVYRMTGRDAG